MIHPDSAYELMIKDIKLMDFEEIEISNALGRVLYEDIYSTLNSPPFDKSAMDGFAYNLQDEGKPLKIAGIIAAGDTKDYVVKNEDYVVKNEECIEIMTGAKIPIESDKVIQIENVTIKDGYLHFTPLNYANIIYEAENLKKGDIVLPKIILKPQQIGILASLGYDKVKVAKQPKVGIITTGTEIIDPGKPLKDGQIYNSNGSQIVAQLKNIYINPTYYGSVSDNPKSIQETIKKALDEQDIVILSGGVSMGKYDFVPDSLKKNDVEIIFHKIAIKPGKPTLFGKKGDKYVFGLPGNPISTFIMFEVVIKPFIYKLMRMDFEPTLIKAKLSTDLKRKKTERFEYRPAEVKNGMIYPIKYLGSSHLNVLALANGLIRFEKGKSFIPKGAELYVRQI